MTDTLSTQSPGQNRPATPAHAASPASPAAVRTVPRMPPWLEKSMPWLVSVTLHLGFFLLAAFILYLAAQALHKNADEEQIIIPTSFTDPTFSNNAGPTSPGIEADPSRAAAQNKLKDLMKADGWAESDSPQNIAGLLEGQTSPNDIDLIVRGSGGTSGSGAAGSGQGGGPIAPYGTPGGSGAATFKSNFYGTGGNANRIVYILDHSGSMMDNFDYLKQETKRSVSNLVPLQFFGVIMVSDTASPVGRAQLERATADVKRQFTGKLDQYVAEGQNNDLLEPFQDAFEKAFKMKPQLIYFLTDGQFDARLINAVDRLNVGHKVRINTLAFVTEEPGYKEQLQDLAKRNGGVYKFISERDAQGQ